MKYRAIIVGLIAGTVYGLIARLLFEKDVVMQYETMSLAFLFVVPAVIGAITVYAGTEIQKASRLFWICMPWVTIFAFLYTTIITYLEATLCVVMLLPAFMLSATLGGVIMGRILKQFKSKQQTLSIFLALPFFSLP